MSEQVVEASSSIHDSVPHWLAGGDMDLPIMLTAITAIEFGIKKLFDGVIDRPKTVNMNLTRIPLSEEGKQDLGLCRQPYLPNEGAIPNELTIDIHVDQSYESLALSVLHELVHAQQIFDGRLGLSRIKSGPNGLLKIWEGRAFSRRLMAYEDWPWEVEARDVSEQLLAELIEKGELAEALHEAATEVAKQAAEAEAAAQELEEVANV